MGEITRENLCLVYARESPEYPERLFGLGDIVPQGRVPITLRGTALAISCVSLRTNSVGTEEIMPVGLMQSGKPSFLRFAEQCVAMLVTADEKILVYDTRAPWEVERWITAAKEAGFETIPGGRGAVFLGTKEQLSSFRWLDGTGTCGSILIITSPLQQSALEREIIDNARHGGDSYGLLQEYYDRLYWHPVSAMRRLYGFRLYVSLGGLEDGADLAVNTSATDIGDVQGAFGDLATSLGVPLYYAGSLNDLDRARFFEASYEWRPMPAGWRRIA